MPQHVRSDTEQAESPHRVALALHCERRHRFDRGRVADEPPGLLADEHFAGAGRLLEPSSHVHRVADEDLLPMDRVADHHLAGVHAGPQGKAHAHAASSSPFNSASASPSSAAARSACNASSSCTGECRTAITASPMNLATVPP